MKISVITISFNQAPYLRQCIESVLAQNYEDFEYIVVDPGSTDGSREIIDLFGARINRIYASDSGPADGLNAGFAAASGDIFCFINADDFFLPGAFSAAIAVFKKLPKTELVLSGGARVDSCGLEMNSHYPSKVSVKAYVHGAVTFFQQGMFFRSKLFQQVNGFNASNKTCWDGELLFRFLLRGVKPVRIMKRVAAFRYYPTSITGSGRLRKQYESDQLRLFQEVYGEGAIPGVQMQMLYRAWKIIGDPIYTFTRFFGDKLR